MGLLPQAKMNKRWEQSDFAREAEAWIVRLKENPSASPKVSLEFSNWTFRSGFLIRRLPERELEVHIVWSPNYGCPILLMRSIQGNDPLRDLPELGEGFIGGPEHHPVLDQVFYAVHACETKTWMGFIEQPEIVPGLALLSWWSVLMNRALRLGIDPDLFAQARLCLEAGLV